MHSKNMHVMLYPVSDEQGMVERMQGCRKSYLPYAL